MIFECPKCSELIDVESERAGSNGKCPHCGGKIPIPQSARERVEAILKEGRTLKTRVINAGCGVIVFVVGTGLSFGTVESCDHYMLEKKFRAERINRKAKWIMVEGDELERKLQSARRRNAEWEMPDLERRMEEHARKVRDVIAEKDGEK